MRDLSRKLSGRNFMQPAVARLRDGIDPGLVADMTFNFMGRMPWEATWLQDIEREMRKL